MEGYDAIGWVGDSKLFNPQLTADVRLGRCGTTVIKVLQDSCVSGERQQYLATRTTILVDSEHNIYSLMLV